MFDRVRASEDSSSMKGIFQSMASEEVGIVFQHDSKVQLLP